MRGIAVVAAITATAITGGEAHAAPQESRAGKIGDAEAMVTQQWQQQLPVLEAIDFAYRCGWVDYTSANSAILVMQRDLVNDVFAAGLAGDRKFDVQALTRQASEIGSKAAKHGACAKISPADRARLRTMVNNLAAG